MEVKLELTDNNNSYIIKNLYPLYLHDISEYDGSLPNKHGLIDEPEEVKTLAQQGDVQNGWWKKPESLFPFLITVDNIPAGFNLIATHPHVPVEGIDFVVHEFFLLHGFRGKNVGEFAAIEGFNKFKGKWEVVTYPAQKAAIKFWRKVLKKYTNDKFTEREGNHPWGRKIIFHFDNNVIND